MFCTKCGAHIEEDSATFCTNCGAKLVEPDTVVLPKVHSMDATFEPKSEPEASSSPTFDTRPAAAQTTQMSAAQVAQPAATPAKESDGSKTNIVVIAATAVVALVVVAVVALFATGIIDLGPKKLTVKYDTGGGTAMEAVQVGEGEQLVTPATPTREGYTFDGWYTDAAHTYMASFPMPVNQDMVLYAAWVKEEPKETATAPAETTQQSAPVIVVITPDGRTSGNIQEYGFDDVSDTSNAVVLTADLKGGGQVSGLVRRDSNDCVLSNWEKQAYTVQDIRDLGLNDAELCVARNELYAHSGYEFKNSSLQNYFENCSWYKSVHKTFDLDPGSKEEKTLKSIMEVQESRAGANKWKDIVAY